MITEEKRGFMRMMVDTNVKLTLAETGHILTGRCNDLSATGLSVSVGEPLEPNTLVNIYIDSSHTKISSMNAHAKVIRCSQDDDNAWKVGLEIIQFS